MSKYNVLASRLQKELTAIQLVVETATSQIEKAKSSGDRDYALAAAFSLQNFYTGVERVFEEIAKQVDRSLPSGSSSHKDLLEQMGLDLPTVRPVVLRDQTLDQLQDYRGFRHVAIHRYGFELKLNRIQELVASLPDCYSNFATDLQVFCDFLQKLESQNN